jgi:type IV pilus assembly protein PilV
MTADRNRMHACSAELGMTLIEILVAIVVLSIGLLGLAGLQLKGVQVNQGSTYRWQAAMLAEDMADRIRADTAAAQAGYYAYSGTVSTGAGAATQATINEWLARVKGLPNGAATIQSVAGGAPGQMRIDVSWDDSRAVNGASSGSPSTGPQTRTFTLKSEMWN